MGWILVILMSLSVKLSYNESSISAIPKIVEFSHISEDNRSSGEGNQTIFAFISFLILAVFLASFLGFILGNRYGKSQQSIRIKQLRRNSELLIPTVDSSHELEIKNLSSSSTLLVDQLEKFKNFVENGKLKHCFKTLGFLGRGGFGHVFKAKHLLEAQVYAIKRIALNINFTKELEYDVLFREVRNASKLNSKHLIRYFNSWVESSSQSSEVVASSSASDDSECSDEYEDQENEPHTVCYLYIQLEYFPGITLGEWLSETLEVNRHDNFHIFSQLLKGIQHIHSHNLIHRDIKPSNIFIDEDLQVKIGDFGLSVLSSEEKDSSGHSIEVGTPQYAAPEQSQPFYDQKVDIFALGLVLLELSLSFATIHEKFVVFKNLRKNRELPNELCWLEKALVLWMTDSDPTRRPNANELIKSKLLNRWKNQFI